MATGAPQISLGKLRTIRSRRSREIKRALLGYVRTGRLPEDEIFLELVFCILTPQSRARSAEKAISSLKSKGFPARRLLAREIRASLSGVRFPNNKTKYLLLAREAFLGSNGRISIVPSLPLSNPLLSREILVKRVKGLGMKEASHFLRNIGKGSDLAILDVHVLRRLVPLGIITALPKSLSKKSYLSIEDKMRRFSERVKIPLAELDLLLWSDGTGEIFK